MQAEGKKAELADDRAAELCERMAAGSEEAFHEFYDLYTRRVYAVLFSLTGGDENLTGELHQLVFIRAARKIPRVVSERKLWNWLCAVARHALVDHVRRNTRRRQREEICGEALVEVSSAEEAMLDRLDAALTELPPEERELVQQFYFGEESQERMAEQRGTTIKAIQAKLARLRLKLRSRLMRKGD